MIKAYIAKSILLTVVLTVATVVWFIKSKETKNKSKYFVIVLCIGLTLKGLLNSVNGCVDLLSGTSQVTTASNYIVSAYKKSMMMPSRYMILQEKATNYYIDSSMYFDLCNYTTGNGPKVTMQIYRRARIVDSYTIGSNAESSTNSKETNKWKGKVVK